MIIKKSIVSIGMTPCIVVQFNYTPPKDKDVSERRRHFIEVLQRDEVMTTYIDDFLVNLNKTMNITEAKEIVYQCLPIFKEKFKTLEDLSFATMHIKCEGKAILFLSRKNLRLVKDDLNTSLSKSINKFYIISPQEEEFEFIINKEVFQSSNIKRKITTFDIRNLLYALAYEKYNIGHTSEALDIISLSLKDRYLSKTVLNAFTAKEREKCTAILLKAARNKKIKLQSTSWTWPRLVEGEILEGEILEDGPCFMDLLQVFEKNGDRFIPIPSAKYRRIGKKVIDNYNAFKRDKAVKLAADFRNLVFSKERLNISVWYEIPGFVTINPRQAKSVGFKTNVFSSKIFREQTIIKDGEININRFQALVSKETLKYLSSLDIGGLYTFSESNDYDYAYEDHTLIEINISKLPVLSRSYVLKSDSLDYILDTYYEQRTAECKQKVTKYFIEHCSKGIVGGSFKYTKEQYELLKTYGLDSNGVYEGIDNKEESGAEDPYKYRAFEFGLKGFSTLPKVESLLKKMAEGKKKLNGPEVIMESYINYIREKHLQNNLNVLNCLFEEQKSIIRTSIRKLAQIKLVKTLTGGWWQGLKLDNKGNYFYEREEKTLVVKVTRKSILN